MKCTKSSCFQTERSSSSSKSIYMSKDKIVGIQHETTVNNVIKILNRGELISKIQALRENLDIDQPSSTGNSKISIYEFPGVFTSLIRNVEIGEPINKYYKKEVLLIFSKVLLKQHNYHIRLHDNMGHLDKDAYTKKSLNDIADRLLSDNELVFHDPISLQALESILVTDRNIYKKLYPILQKINKEDLLVFTQTYPDINYNKYCDLPVKTLNKMGIINTRLKPNFCYYIPSGTPEHVIPRFAENCGLNITNIDKDTLRNIRKMDKLLEKPVNDSFNGRRIKPKWIPGINLFD